MKKNFLAFLVVFFVMALCGCSSVTEGTVEKVEDYVIIGGVAETTMIMPESEPETKTSETTAEEAEKDEPRDESECVEESTTICDSAKHTASPPETTMAPANEAIQSSTTTPVLSTTVNVTSAVNPATSVTTTTVATDTECTNPPFNVVELADTGFPNVTKDSEDNGYYIVELGESWGIIASKFQIDADDLARYNNKDISYILYPGDVLVIPQFVMNNGQIENDEEELANPDFSVVSVIDDELVCYGAETKTSWTAANASFTNMEIACETLNCVVAYIPPGGTFSWLGDVGPCNSDPYVLSDSFSNGTVIKAYGGGICMVASALKVAAWRAGCVITETHPHSLPVPYNSRNREDWELYESTVDASGQDLKFYNPSESTGLVISAYVDRSGHSVTVELIPD